MTDIRTAHPKTRFLQACKKAFEGRAKRSYFEHTGALMTADGSDDHLIKLEAKPKGEAFTFMLNDVPDEAAVPDSDEEPDDVAPRREEGDGSAELELDEEDDPDDEDAPPAPREAPDGFAFAATPPAEAALAYSKEALLAADALVGKSILFNWPVVGWHVGVIQRRVLDGRIKRDKAQCNFYIYYEVDEDEVCQGSKSVSKVCMANVVYELPPPYYY